MRRAVWLGLIVVLAPLLGGNMPRTASAEGETFRMERVGQTGLKLTMVVEPSRTGQVRIQIADGRTYKITSLSGPTEPGIGQLCKQATIDFYCQFFMYDNPEITVQIQTDKPVPDETKVDFDFQYLDFSGASTSQYRLCAPGSNRVLKTSESCADFKP